MFAFADVAAHFFSLLESEPKRRLVRHRMKHEHVHAPVWLPADVILRKHVTASPGLVPGNGSLFEERNHPVGDYLIRCVFHCNSLSPPPASTGRPGLGNSRPGLGRHYRSRANWRLSLTWFVVFGCVLCVLHQSHVASGLSSFRVSLTVCSWH